MCGITGIYNFAGDKPVERELLHRMCEAIKHRGPDSEGIFIGENVGLGARRLAIIDLKTGDQPLHNEDRTLWIVHNGEIYNFLELKKGLEKKHKFYTKTDEEVILHLYEEYGEGCVQYLRGMFAFAIWDARNRKLFIARDRLGQKPLYYTVANGSLIFASEIKAILLHLDKTPGISLEAIDDFLTYQYIPAPMTIFKGIKSLPAAHTFTCGKDGEIKIEKYWDLDFTRKTNLSFKDSCEKLRSLITEATRLRMVSDVPLGALLSGGQDSSIIVGLMSQFSSRPVKTFSIGFEENEFSELRYARIVAKHFKTEHHEFVLKPNFIEVLPRIVWYYGQPFADTSALPSYFVSSETRRHVTVALNGDGGDENFGGYLRYKAMKASLYFSFLFKIFGNSITRHIAFSLPQIETTERNSIFCHVSRFVSALAETPEMKHVLWQTFFTSEQKQKIYTDSMASELCDRDAYQSLAYRFRNAPAGNIMDRSFYADIKTYLPECLLVKMDIASMANSLETRSPFLDHKVMEFSASLPHSWKIRGLTTKYILKKSVENFIPGEILKRGKMGFGIPVGKWFREDWKNYFREIVLSPRAISRGYFEKKSLETMFNEHTSGQKDHGYCLWALLNLELWHMAYIDNKVR